MLESMLFTFSGTNALVIPQGFKPWTFRTGI